MRARKRHKPDSSAEDLSGTKGVGFDDYSILSITDSAGRFLYVNDRYCQITGYDREELIGNAHPLFLPDEEPLAVEEFKAAIQQNEPWRGVLHSRSKAGLNCWLATSVVPVWDKQRQEKQFLCSQHNITSAIERECRRLISTGQKDTERLLGTVIHEIGNPLTTVKGFLQQFNSSVMFRQQQVELLLSELMQIEQTIQKLLDWTRVHQNRSFQVCGLGELIQTAIGQSLERGDGREVSFLVHDPGQLTICCIEEQIQGLLLCLFEESIQLMGGSGTIRVEVLEVEERQVAVRISREKGKSTGDDWKMCSEGEEFIQEWGKIIRNQIVAHHGAELKRSLFDGGRMELFFPLPDPNCSSPT